MKHDPGLFARLVPKSLKNKLLCAYFLLVALPLGIFTLYAYLRVRSVVQEQTFIAAQNAFEDTASSIQQALGRLDAVLDILAMDPLVYQMASNDPDDYSYIRRLEDSDKLALTFEHLCSLSGIERIRLYADNNYLYRQSNITQLREVADHEWYDTLLGQSGRMWFAPADFNDQALGEQSWFSSMQVIYNPRNVKEPLAVLRADADASRIIRLAESTSITENGILLLLKDKEILYHSSNSTLSETLYAIVDELPDPDTGNWDSIQAEGKHYYVQCCTLPRSGWYMASILPFDDVFRLSHELRFELLAAVLLISVIAYLLAVAISRSTLKRISLLTQTMQAVQEGNVTVRPEPSGNDEIAQLMGNFNRMMDRIDQLMNEKVLYGQQIKNLELKALQAQINPHFLYNTLNAITWQAADQGAEEISILSSSLGRFFRVSLSKGAEIISLREELDHVTSYLEIQSIRYHSRLNYEIRVEEPWKVCRVIKLCLQPLAENSIYHGIKEKENSGLIRIWAEEGWQEETPVLCLVVWDDGAGIPKEKLDIINENLKMGRIDHGEGYGIYNVNERLRLFYGESYGLRYESEEGKWTKGILTLPISK